MINPIHKILFFTSTKYRNRYLSNQYLAKILEDIPKSKTQYIPGEFERDQAGIYLTKRHDGFQLLSPDGGRQYLSEKEVIDYLGKDLDIEKCRVNRPQSVYLPIKIAKAHFGEDGKTLIFEPVDFQPIEIQDRKRQKAINE